MEIVSCSLCGRVKDWNGSLISCPFQEGDFTPDNWRCGQIRRLRNLVETRIEDGNSGVASLRVEGYTQALLDLQDYEELVEYHNLFELASVRYPNSYPPGHPNANMYYLKQTPSQTVESGDRIFIHSIRSGFTKKEVLAHLASKGATVVSDIESSNKILINSRNSFEWDRFEKLPTEVDPLIARYSTRILFDTIKNDIRKVRNLSREIQTFDLQVYDNIVHLLKSGLKKTLKLLVF